MDTVTLCSLLAAVLSVSVIVLFVVACNRALDREELAVNGPPQPPHP